MITFAKQRTQTVAGPERELAAARQRLKEFEDERAHQIQQIARFEPIAQGTVQAAKQARIRARTAVNYASKRIESLDTWQLPQARQAVNALEAQVADLERSALEADVAELARLQASAKKLAQLRGEPLPQSKRARAS